MPKVRLIACGIVAEYNPFHNGHLYQLQQAKRKSGADILVVVMSGNFTQRGEIALIDKWQRTKMALDAGVDLVVELPFNRAVQPANLFAQGAVEMLAQLQCQFLAFGTENEGLNYNALGQALNQLPKRHELFVDYQKTFATQMNELVQQQLGVSFKQPNVLLGVNYARYNALLPQPMRLVPIQRVGVAHDELRVQQKYTSASWLRQSLLQGKSVQSIADYLPLTTQKILADFGKCLSWNDCFAFLKYRITSMTLAELANIYQVSEGLEYRIKHVIRHCQTFSELIHAIKTKRYTYARIQRVLLYILLNVTERQMLMPLNSLYLLGFSESGRNYLNQIKKQLALPLLSRVSGDETAEHGIFYLQNRVDLLVEQLTGHDQNYGRHPLYVHA